MFEALPGVYVGEGPDLTTPKSKFVRNRLQNCCLDLYLTLIIAEAGRSALALFIFDKPIKLSDTYFFNVMFYSSPYR